MIVSFAFFEHLAHDVVGEVLIDQLHMLLDIPLTVVSIRRLIACAAVGEILQLLCVMDKSPIRLVERDSAIVCRSFEPQIELDRDPLRVEGKHLLKAWKSFRKQLPLDGTRDQFQRRKPVIHDVITMVKDISLSWNAKRKKGKSGAVKNCFHKVCAGLSSHETMLQVLPVASDVNHEKIASGFSKSFGEITDCVNECGSIQKFYDTEMDMMSWYLAKQHQSMLDAFREDLYETFADHVLVVREITRKIKHQAELGSMAEQRVVRLDVQSMRAELADVRLGLEGHARATAEVAETVKRLDRRAEAESKRKSSLISDEPRKMSLLAALIYERTTEGLEIRATEFNNEIELKAAFAHTKGMRASERNTFLHFDRDQVHLSVKGSADATCSSKISNRLRDFVEDAEATFLAVAGPRLLDNQGISPTTMIAASFVKHAKVTGIPIISWFCDLTDGSVEHNNDTKEAHALVSLVYALIRQLIDMFPLKPDEPIGVDIGAFERLDGALASMDSALKLLKHAIEQIDFMLFIVIDGLESLDDASTWQYLETLITTLVSVGPRSAESSEQRHPLVRVLMTTMGRSRALLGALDADVYLLADEDGRKRRDTRTNRVPW
ncbi:hypothetical protein Q7P37_002278 [Cladosporium fusiforme]